MLRAFFLPWTSRFDHYQFADISGQFTNVSSARKGFLTIITLAVDQTPELKVTGGSIPQQKGYVNLILRFVLFREEQNY